jgi:hypothetical protein
MNTLYFRPPSYMRAYAPVSERLSSLGPPDRVHGRRSRNQPIRPCAKLTAQPESGS